MDCIKAIEDGANCFGYHSLGCQLIAGHGVTLLKIDMGLFVYA